MAPRELVPILGVESAIAAWLLGAAAAVGVLLIPISTPMGRVGALVLAVPAATFAVAGAIAPQPDRGTVTGIIALDIVFTFMIPAGYFILLFGALRAAGWARIGSRVVAVAAVAAVAAATLAVVLFVVPTGPLEDIGMSQRMVAHGLIITGAIVAVLPAAIELARQPMPPP